MTEDRLSSFKVLTLDDLNNLPPRPSLAAMIADASKVPEVKIQGEELTLPIIWVGRQWAVTGHGVEARDGTYAIEIERLWEEMSPGYTWERHLSLKDWVDVPDLAAALAIARQTYQDNRPR